jgi:hypothetical protein
MTLREHLRPLSLGPTAANRCRGCPRRPNAILAPATTARVAPSRCLRLAQQLEHVRRPEAPLHDAAVVECVAHALTDEHAEAG